MDKWKIYGYNIQEYINNALSIVESERITVVTDDVRFCQRLDFGNRNVSYNEGGPVSDFARLLSADVLIGTNSTFSYWAGFLKRYLKDGSRLIYPDFGNMLINNGQFFVDARNFEIIKVTR